MSDRVVITGLGVVSSIGIGWQEFWENLLAGKSGISPVTSFDTKDYFTHNGGEVKQFRPDDFIGEGMSTTQCRTSQMAVAAALMAANDANLAIKGSRESIAISVGTNGGTTKAIENIDDYIVCGRLHEINRSLSAQVPTNRIVAEVALAFGVCGPCSVFSTACSAGNYAIGHGYDLIRQGKATIVLAGASDAFSRIAFTGFNQFKAVAPHKCQPFDRNRKGMMVAEGAAFMVLEPLDLAVARGAPIYGEVAGYGLSCDAHHMTASAVHGIVDCMENALRASRLTASDVDYISAHGTGTPTNDKNECAAIRQVFGERTREIPVSSIKSMLGHTMGAASALEAVACVLTVKYGTIPPTVNYETPDPDCDIDCVPNRARTAAVAVALNNSYAFGGNNASLVIKNYHQGA